MVAPAAVVDFRLLFESAPGLYLVLLPDLTICGASDAYLRATKTVREEILGRGIFDVFPDNPDDPGATGVGNLRSSLARVMASGVADAMAVQKYDIARPASEGGGFEERFWSPVNSPVKDAFGRIVFINHRVEDVTEFVRLRRLGSEQDKIAAELRTLAGSMEAEIYRRAQQIQEANRDLRELQTQLEARVLARTDDLERANAELRREIAEREQAEAALKASEEQLRQAQKMEAVGRLAGGVAHDFNNVLSVILSYSEVLGAQFSNDEAVRADLEEIRVAGTRAADLTRQLLAFSRQQVLAPKIVDLNQTVGRMHKMVARLIGEDVELRMVTPEGLGTVKVDPGQIEQVIMNLVVNARDAMPRGGIVTLETANIYLDSDYAAEHVGVTAGEHVMLAVTDTGEGMDRATQARIFEPFFTTKELGKGTGLGLSMVFGIVKQSGGHIWVYSEPGRGTVFKIYLPRVLGAGVEPRSKRPALARGAETILLVEDEDQVRKLARSILTRSGYSVIDAKNAAEALERSRELDGPIDLMLTDVVMPKTSGRELAERIRSSRPATKVLFMSGYTDDTVVRHGVLEAGIAFLQKPLTPDALTRRVREVLDGKDDADR